MGRNENDAQRQQKKASICASEGDIYMHALGGQHCKGYRLSRFQSTPKKHYRDPLSTAKKPWNLTAGTWKCFIWISKSKNSS